MARTTRAHAGMNEAPDLLVLIERARASAASPGTAPQSPAPPCLAPFDLASAGPAPSRPAPPDDVPAGIAPTGGTPHGQTLPGLAPSGAPPSGSASTGPAPADITLSGTHGHRSRMRTRLLTAGPWSLADHEMLEMVLFLALPRRDTKPLARVLLTRFGSFAGAIAAPVSELSAIDGLGDAGVAALKTVQAAALRLARAE